MSISTAWKTEREAALNKAGDTADAALDRDQQSANKFALQDQSVSGETTGAVIVVNAVYIQIDKT